MCWVIICPTCLVTLCLQTFLLALTHQVMTGLMSLMLTSEERPIFLGISLPPTFLQRLIFQVT